VVFAGKEYGTGSSRDWAAKGAKLLGVRAVIAESFERIHRTNLVGMGVLPLQFLDGENAASLQLTGRERYSVEGVKAALSGAARRAHVRAVDDSGAQKTFEVLVRVDTPQEVEYYRYGGILPFVLSQIAAAPVGV
jgi:aconitate hydratase